MEEEIPEKMPKVEEKMPTAEEGMRMLVKEVLGKTLEEHPELNIPESEKSKYEDLMITLMTQNKTPMEAMGFSNEMLEHMYAYGHRLYNNGNYKKAKDVFSSLMVFQPDDARFYLGQAACHQRLGEWEKAASAYHTCSLLDAQSPMPPFYMYECLNQLKNYEDAAACLKETIARCGNTELFANIKERCLLLLQSIPSQKTKVQELAQKSGE